jgi:hypothetical protein
LRLPPSSLGEMPQKLKAFSDRRIALQAFGTSSFQGSCRPSGGIIPENHGDLEKERPGICPAFAFIMLSFWLFGVPEDLDIQVVL